jgi:hypothetical protein
MSRARDNANLGAQAGSGLDASDITTGALPVGVTGGSGLNALSASNLSAGTIADARMPNLTGAITTVEGAVATTIANDAVDSQHYAAGSIDNEHLADDAVGSDELANDVVINTSGAITTTGLATVAKIVETGGVLKENLITNSGFDVWSNSTFETYGSDLKDTNLYAMNGMNSAHVSGPEITNATYTGGSSGSNPEFRGSELGNHVIGSTYRFQYTIASSGNPSALRMYVQGNMFTSAAVGTFTHYYTATQVNPLTQYLVLAANTLPATTTTNTSIYQMIPGCVAADTLACDGWYKSATADIWRQPPHATYTKDGSYYSMKVTTGSTADVISWKNTTTRNEMISVARFAGRTVTFGAWVYTTTASHIKLSIDTSSSSESAFHGGGGWEWMELTQAVPAATTMFWCRFNHSVSGITSYISQPMLVFGSSIGAGNYTRPKGEVINCETQITISPLDGTVTVSSDTNYNLEFSTNGKIPKGVKALTLRGFKTPNAVGNYFGISSDTGWQYLTYSPTANNETFHARCVTDNDQHLEIMRNATFTGVHIGVNAIELE